RRPVFAADVGVRRRRVFTQAVAEAEAGVAHLAGGRVAGVDLLPAGAGVVAALDVVAVALEGVRHAGRAADALGAHLAGGRAVRAIALAAVGAALDGLVAVAAEARRPRRA